MKRLGALAVLLLVGCAPVTPAAPASSTPPPTPTLVASRQVQGGLCMSGRECRSLLSVRSDGRWFLEGGETRQGTLAPEQLAELQDAVTRTTLSSAPPFTGTCPTASDGQEYTFIWVQGGSRHSVASCDRELDPADPLVVAFEQIAAEVHER